MNTINNFILEKLNKTKSSLMLEKLKVNSKSKINDEEFYEKTSTNLFNEVQNEIDKLGEYHTYDFADGRNKFKKGFLTFNGKFFTVTAFNSAKEFAEMMGTGEDTYKQYDNIKVGGCIEWGESNGSISQILRIW